MHWQNSQPLPWEKRRTKSGQVLVESSFVVYAGLESFCDGRKAWILRVWYRRSLGESRSQNAGELARLGLTKPRLRKATGVENYHFARTRYLRRSEEHTSELQSHSDLVCRLLLEKKKYKTNTI